MLYTHQNWRKIETDSYEREKKSSNDQGKTGRDNETNIS